MRARFDQFTKSIFREALTPAGTVRIQEEVVTEAQAIDTLFVPDPARAHALDDLGYLGKMARVPSVFEAYHNTMDVPEYRGCVRKQLTLDHLECSKARRQRLPVPPFPRLWMFSAGRAERVLKGYGFTPIRGWPPGFHERCEEDAIGLVVLRELPRTRETLLLRLMASGEVLNQAIDELMHLLEGAREREVAMTSLVAFRAMIYHDPVNEEREFLMSTEPLYDEWEKQVKNQGRVEGRVEGRAEGRAEEAAHAVLTVLRVRGLAVPDEVRERILAQREPARLERWLERAAVASSIAEVLDEPS